MGSFKYPVFEARRKREREQIKQLGKAEFRRRRDYGAVFAHFARNPREEFERFELWTKDDKGTRWRYWRGVKVVLTQHRVADFKVFYKWRIEGQRLRGAWSYDIFVFELHGASKTTRKRFDHVIDAIKHVADALESYGAFEAVESAA